MKLPVPNICATSGVSYDFRLAYGNLNNHLERIEANESARTRFLAKRAFLHRPIPHYEEFFGAEKHGDVVTEKNCDVIKKINECIDELNKLREAGVTDYEQLAPFRNRLDHLVSGKASVDTQ